MSERITIDDLGLDEILLDGVDVHVERMDRGHIWFGFSRRGEPLRRLSVSINAAGKTLKATILENDVGVETTPKR